MKPPTTTIEQHQALVGGACGMRPVAPVHPVPAAYGIDPRMATSGAIASGCGRARLTGFGTWNESRRLEAFVT